jgi:hypothetical protein
MMAMAIVSVNVMAAAGKALIEIVQVCINEIRLLLEGGEFFVGNGTFNHECKRRGRPRVRSCCLNTSFEQTNIAGNIHAVL